MKTNEIKRVCHLTSAHDSEDTRIFHKQCTSLADNGYEVYLVSHGKSYIKNKVNIIGIGDKSTSRISRMFNSTRKIYSVAEELKADLYHIHDPELLPYAMKLKKSGAKVIFDSHEDYLSTISEKTYFPRVTRKMITNIFKKYEEYVIKNIDGAITCYHWTQERYNKLNRKVEMILNYPIVTKSKPISRNNESRKIAFAGNISEQWNHHQLIDTLKDMKNVEYELAGKINSKDYESRLKNSPGWKHVNYHGVIPFEKVQSEIYEESAVGICLLDYIPQTKGKIGNLSNTKFFEILYMGLPIICTDFNLWKDIIKEEKCGIYVNPHNTIEIKNAINYLLENKNKALQMGIRGQKAVLKKYNWSNEKQKLFKLYSDVL